jgi:photosystem II stability/assembly factor-like uncharacterized protein
MRSLLKDILKNSELMKRIIIIGISLLLIAVAFLVTIKLNHKPLPIFFEDGNLKSYHIDDVQRVYKNKKKKIKNQEGYYKHYKPDMFLEYYHGIRTTWDQQEVMYPANYKQIAFNNHNTGIGFKSATAVEGLSFIQRGPSNVGGRTRGIVYDPSDPAFATWFVASASGGIWKTTDAGDNWQNLTENMPNLSTSCIAMSESNNDVLYVGTGEGYAYNFSFVRGEGIYKSIDRGTTWTQIAATAVSRDFDYVNRLAIHPTDENIVIATTNAGIIKTTDGFETWQKVFEVEDTANYTSSDYAFAQGLDATSDFSKIYATFRGYGVAVSTDQGETWTLVEDLIGQGDRFEVAVSEADENYVYLVSEVRLYYQQTWVSNDGGNYWKNVRILDGYNPNYLWGQGWYDMAITGHPYKPNKFFVGGTNIGLIEFVDTVANDITGLDTINTGSFLDLVNFGATYADGRIEMEPFGYTEIVYEDIVNVEVRFGPNRSQKAHRFRVPDEETSGVPYGWYEYLDYVDVPFEVWDTDNNRQLMVSFRDQELDSVFNLYETRGSGYGEQGREYIFVHALEYDANNPHSTIGNTEATGTHTYKQFIQLWPTYAGNGVWDESTAPESLVRINVDKINLFDGSSTVISDAYGIYVGGGKNIDLHPDHHTLLTIKAKPEWELFYLISANDGGIAISDNEGTTWTTKENGYITSQFYSATKKRNEDVYLGGTQDNGSFVSPFDGALNSESVYQMVMGGDGFETIWSYQNPDRAMVSVYNNFIYRTLDGGKTWIYGWEGIDNSTSPFITRLASSVSSPDVIYCVGYDGIYKSEDFGTSWNLTKIDRNWRSGQISSNMASYHNVKVSLANDRIVWGGASLDSDASLSTFVSTDAGETYSEVNEYDLRKMPTYLTGIATHPHDDSTAYLLFSAPELPKILRTTDLGQTWEDISGFTTEISSSNGFPDVGVLSLFVMPQQPEVIWAGTEIGIFESSDNGASWHKLDSDLPAVSIWQMTAVDDQVVLASFGRGIWTANVPALEYIPILFDVKALTTSAATVRGELDTPYDQLDVYVNGELTQTIENPEEGEEVTFTIDVVNSANIRVQCVGHYMGSTYTSNIVVNTEAATGIDDNSAISAVKVYPNPASDYVNFDLDKSYRNQNMTVSVYDLGGRMILNESMSANVKNQLDISMIPSGNYLLKVTIGSKELSSRIVKK